MERLSQTLEQPTIEQQTAPVRAPQWLVTIYDNEVNTYEEVIFILVLATGCSEEEAYIETWEVDHLGKSVVHVSDKEECTRVAEVIATIGIRVEVTPED